MSGKVSEAGSEVRRCVVVSGPIDQSPAPQSWDQTRARQVTDRTLRPPSTSPRPSTEHYYSSLGLPSLPPQSCLPAESLCQPFWSDLNIHQTSRCELRYLFLFPGSPECILSDKSARSYLLLSSSLSHHHLFICEGSEARHNKAMWISTWLIRPCMFWLEQGLGWGGYNEDRNYLFWNH